jgi:hypothetical protein
MTANRRRPGVTLIEVLMATGILAVGLLAILALFPIGAVNMARAITQSRSADQGANSDAVFRVYWKNAWVDATGGGVRATSEEAFQASQEPVLLLLDAHPNRGPISGQGASPEAIAATTQPGFPVLVDPIGWQTKVGNTNEQQFVAGVGTLPVRTTLRRCIADSVFTRPVPPMITGAFVQPGSNLWIPPNPPLPPANPINR